MALRPGRPADTGPVAELAASMLDRRRPPLPTFGAAAPWQGRTPGVVAVGGVDVEKSEELTSDRQSRPCCGREPVPAADPAVYAKNTALRVRFDLFTEWASDPPVEQHDIAGTPSPAPPRGLGPPHVALGGPSRRLTVWLPGTSLRLPSRLRDVR